MQAYCFAIFVSLATIIIVLYNILTVTLPNLATAYNYWAVLALDIFGVVFWLSAMGAIAALRNSFFDISFNIFKRSIEKRLVLATDGYLGAMSGAAAVSGFNLCVSSSCHLPSLLTVSSVLFVITLVFTGLALHKARKEGSATAADDSKLESHGMEAVQQPPPPASYGGAPPPANYGAPPPANY